MATRKPKVAERITVLNPDTGELVDMPDDVLPPRNRAKDAEEQAIDHEERTSRSHRRIGAHDWAEDRLFNDWKVAAVALVAIAAGAVLGIWGRPIIDAQTQAAQVHKALATSIPVVQAAEVSIDPGRFVGKLTDVIMIPTSGAVFRSRKGLFLSENSLGLSLTIFESAFEVFQEAYGVAEPDDIAPYLIGKTIKARGVVQQRMQPNGEMRTSMIISAPGLIQILPDYQK